MVPVPGKHWVSSRKTMALTLHRTRIEQSPAFAHLEDWDVA